MNIAHAPPSDHHRATHLELPPSRYPSFFIRHFTHSIMLLATVRMGARAAAGEIPALAGALRTPTTLDYPTPDCR